MLLLRRGLLPLLALLLGSWVGAAKPWPFVGDRRPPPGDTTTSPSAATTNAATATTSGADPSAMASAPGHFVRAGAPSYSELNPHASVSLAWQLAQGPAYDASDKRRLVTLSFDDGPFLETTPKILSTLAKHHVHASFFLIGQYLDGDDTRAKTTRQLVRSIAAAGHAIGNHTHDHQLLTTLTHAEALAQIDEGAASIERAIGRKPTYFRPPFGQLDSFTEAAVSARETELVLWSVETQDMKRADTDAMLESLERQIEQAGGGIVLLHDIRWSTVAALPSLLDWLHRRRFDPARPNRIGYEVVDLPYYLRATAEHPPLPRAHVPVPASAHLNGV